MTDSADKSRPRPSLLRALGLPILLLGLAATGFLLRGSLMRFVESPQALRAWVSRWGSVAPLVFFSVQVLQVFVFVIPGDTVQIAGGYLFGFWQGLALSLAGIATGTTIDFWLARALGRPLVQRLVPPAQLERFASIASSPRTQAGFFLLFVIPGIPKDILCYVAGLSQLRFVPFLVLSLLGRLPGIVGSTLMGSSAAKDRWGLTVALLVVAALLAAAGYLLRDRVHAWIDSLSHRSRE